MNGLGSLIKDKRNELNISQRELAKLINVDNSLISRIENGEVLKPNLFILFNLSDKLDLSIIDLLKACNYDGIDIDLLNHFEDFEIFGVPRNMDTQYIDSKGKVDLNKVVEDYRQNKLDEFSAFGIFYKCLGLNDRGIVNLSFLYHILRNKKK